MDDCRVRCRVRAHLVKQVVISHMGARGLFVKQAIVCVHRLSHVPICVELPQPILTKNRCDRRSLKALLG
jgi:hypothetical protein